MFYNYYSRIHYIQQAQTPQSYNQFIISPRMSVVPTSMKQMRESTQIPFIQDPMKASSILETGQRTRNTYYKKRLEELYLKYEDGCIYRGQGIPPTQRHGLGVLFNEQNQEVYSGEWNNNLFEGFGILINQEPQKLKNKIDPKNLNMIEDGWQEYKGYFKQNKMHGEGILKLTNGQKFEGHFQNGMIHGKGKFYGDQIIIGFWYEGILIQ